MPTLEQQIEALDDTTAARLLRVFARANSATEQGLALTADLKEGLEKCADVTPLTAAPINEGDMARSALLFLGSEPDYRDGKVWPRWWQTRLRNGCWVRGKPWPWLPPYWSFCRRTSSSNATSRDGGP